MRCAIYCRVSTDGQRERQTIASQLRLLPEYAAKEGWTIVDQYVDDGVSGETIEERPSFVRLLADVERGLVDAILVMDLDRLTRSKSQLTRARIWDHLQTFGCQVATPTQGLIDPRNDVDALTIGIMGGVSSYEKRMILKRTQRGKREVARRGQFHCSVDPFGYQWDPKARCYVINPTEAAAVKRAYELALEYGINMTGWHLGQEGYLPRKKGHWALTTVGRMLHSRLYLGEYPMFKKDAEPIMVKVPQIIEQAQWQRVQDALSRRLPDAKIKHSREYLVAGSIKCGVCDRSMWAAPDSKTAKQSYAYYRCQTTNQWRSLGLDRPCGNKNHKIMDVDAAVWAKVVEVLRDPQLLAEACALADAPTGVDWVKQAEGAERTLQNLVKVERDMLARNRRGQLSSAALDHELGEINRERELAQRNLRLAQQQLADTGAKQQMIQDLAERAKALSGKIENATFEQRRSILRLVVPTEYGGKIVLNGDRSIEIFGVLSLGNRTVELRLACG